MDVNKIWAGGFAHCASISIPGSKQSEESAMKHLYTQDNQTISMYELHAVNLLNAMNLLSPNDSFDNINKSRNYMLVQQVANSVFVALGRLTYEEIRESIQDDSVQSGSTETISRYEQHIANLRKSIGWESGETTLRTSVI